jgi:hypothetical protein
MSVSLLYRAQISYARDIQTLQRKPPDNQNERVYIFHY